jgi:hypothetical protein
MTAPIKCDTFEQRTLGKTGKIVSAHIETPAKPAKEGQSEKLKTGFGVETLRVRHKNVFHVRFHPAVTQPTKVLKRPPLQPTIEQRFRIACVDPQATAAQLDSVDIGKLTKYLHTIHNFFHMNFQKLAVHTLFQREWRAFGDKLSA